MWLIVQIALGVCAGLWLFRWAVTRPPLRLPTVSGAIRFCAIVIAALWVLHLVLMAYR